MKQVYAVPKSLRPVPTHYCPGCTHGIIHKLVADAIDELGLRDRAVGVASVGCSVFSYDYFDCDFQQAAHGRAPAVATGIRRAVPDAIVFTYQGDGDLASIGTAEIVHAAMRSENITVIFVNNAIYGMTGGQMAPTTLVGQKTTTSPRGRQPALAGQPLRIAEMLATIPGATYVARVSTTSPAHIARAGRAIKKAFQVQAAGEGFSLVECLSTCPTNWGMSPVDAMAWVEKNMIPYYPLGEFRTPEMPETPERGQANG
ncbi:MAG: thiamine pyrophosphate-dependent enzyme [Bacillota bacterium]|jgi:2-oxoglutarate ferredoxin oxidoreductase subunit beta|nr:2-oxoglutarate oxidoreductase [Bacillota bacterium]